MLLPREAARNAQVNKDQFQSGLRRQLTVTKDIKSSSGSAVVARKKSNNKSQRNGILKWLSMSYAAPKLKIETRKKYNYY